MSDEIKACLEDVLHSIRLIDTFLGSVKRFEDYSANLMLKSAVERKIEIIGEALNNAMKLDSALSVTNARKIVDMRNKLIHGYDEVDDSVVWNVLIKHLPALKLEVEKLIQQ